MPKTTTSWTASLVVTALLASAATAVATATLQLPPDPRTPRILTGPDVGFRLDGTDPRNGRPTGTLMVRINGQWVETSAVPGVQLAK